ncbi:O-antigen ligase family protein [Aliiroseovarius crassostreae]|uniref:O-antigen ligase family protein n=1 Tax=Aliiroseovarius crassostreae TaxID=154981 RepID=UPI003C7AAE19
MTTATRQLPGLAPLSTFLGLCLLVTIAYPALVAFPQDVTPGHLLMLICLPVWALASAQRPVPAFDHSGRFAILIILGCCGMMVLCAILSAFIAAEPFRVARTVVSFSTAFAMFTMMNGTATPGRLHLLLATLSLALVGVCILSFLAFFEPGLNAAIFRGADRASGFFKNPNQFGIALSTVLPPTAALFLSNRHKLWWAAALICLILGLIASGSKTNLMISVASVLTLLILWCILAYQGRERVVRLVLAVVAYVTTMALALTVLSVLNPRALALLQQFFQGDTPHSVDSRMGLWEDSLALFIQNPILGVGAGQPIQSGVSHSHNVMLEFARTLGVPGLVLITILILAITICCFDTIRKSLLAKGAPLEGRCVCIGLALSPLAYIAANFTSDSFGPTTSAFLYATLFLGLANRGFLLRAT